MSDFDPPITMNNTAVIPANSQITPLIDTTYWNDTGPWASAASAAAPGKSRGQLAGMRVTLTYLCVTDNSTVTFQIMTNPSGTTNAAFEADANLDGNGGAMVNGVLTAVAGTTYPVSWLPVTPDWRIIITAGATAPSAIRTTMIITPRRTAGA